MTGQSHLVWISGLLGSQAAAACLCGHVALRPSSGEAEAAIRAHAFDQLRADLAARDAAQAAPVITLTPAR